MAENLNTLSLRITTQGGIKNECLNDATSNSDLIGRERERPRQNGLECLGFNSVSPFGHLEEVTQTL